MYIGAAPGVGKTYQMLEDAHAAKEAGSRHSRSGRGTSWTRRNEAMIGDLERIPMRRIEYRNVTLEEMDLEAVIARIQQSRLLMNWLTQTFPDQRIANVTRMCWIYSTPGSL